MTRSTRAALRPFGAAFLAVGIAASMAAGPRASAAKQPEPKITFEEANKHYLAKEWNLSVNAFTALVKAEPGNGRAWFRLGLSHQNLKQYERAIPAFRKSESIGHNPLVMFHLAGAFAVTGGADSAFTWLGRAADAGYAQPETVASTEEFASIRGDARFPALIERMQRAAAPCAFSPEARQFDFWLGSWDVKTTQGDLAGTNDIRIGAGKCVLIENWKSASGTPGQSLNFYDFATKKWNQIWVDASGGVTRFEGTFTDGAMRFQGERVGLAGDRTSVKMTFTRLPDGRVRQLGEATTDGGKTWAIEYDLYYSPARRDG